MSDPHDSACLLLALRAARASIDAKEERLDTRAIEHLDQLLAETAEGKLEALAKRRLREAANRVLESPWLAGEAHAAARALLDELEAKGDPST